jgi:GTPase SAR1 family protein
MSSLSLNENVEFMMKIILIGDSGVGKSNLLLRYCRDEFNLNSKATIGTDFYSKDVCQDDVNVKV